MQRGEVEMIKLMLYVIVLTFFSIEINPNQDLVNTSNPSLEEVEIPVIFESNNQMGCLPVWNVTIKREIDSDGWLLEFLGIPVEETIIICNSGGEFICPTESGCPR